MLTIISTIIGFLSSTLPKLFEFFQDKNDKVHELDIMDKQIALAQLKIGGELDAVGIQAASASEIATINAQSAEMVTMYNNLKTGISWIDGLNALVRPMLAIFFMGAYFLAMYPHIEMAFELIRNQDSFANHHEFISAYQEAIKGIWTENDDAIFAGIISFYFGSKFFENYKRSI
jgi:hypothetical protein